MAPSSSLVDSDVAVILIAHDQPAQLTRLVAAFDPFPVFLHIDANTPAELARRMVQGLPQDRVHLLPRLHAGWGRPEVVLAELSGYRAALQQTSAEHLVVGTGTDFPLVGSTELGARLASARGLTFGHLFALPSRNWLPYGGLDRLLLPQRVDGRRRRVTGPPRIWPRQLHPGGGAQQKIIARDHAARVLQALDDDPALWRFFASCWTPDEVLVPTLLRSPGRTGIDWPAGYAGSFGWYVDWGRGRRPSPGWLGPDSFDDIARARGQGALFARKFADRQEPLTRRICEELW